ncbi:MAG: pyridoxine biosynthesis protein [Bogoriella megaspora]|nr:MAG: pyridoxine biosynthesis protein [Bogoriella megaspora]
MPAMSPSTTEDAVSGARAQRQIYPLYPSVQHLLHTNGLTDKDADKIPASGPSGRLLKGDVLAFLGQIDRSYSASQSQRIEKLGHLDLSNIQMAPKKPADAAKKPAEDPSPTPTSELPIEVTLPIDLAAAVAYQKRLEDTLGIHLPLPTIISRATDAANDGLPRVKVAPTANELFYQILGSSNSKLPKVSRGHYKPQRTSIGPSTSFRDFEKKQPDIYSLLSGRKRSSPARVAPLDPATPTISVEAFTLSVPKAEKDRAQVFLNRMRLVLEEEPGRLVI